MTAISIADIKKGRKLRQGLLNMADDVRRFKLISSKKAHDGEPQWASRHSHSQNVTTTEHSRKVGHLVRQNIC